MRRPVAVASVVLALLAAGCAVEDEEGPSRVAVASASQSPTGTVLTMGFVPLDWGDDPGAAHAAVNADLRAVENVHLTLLYPDGRSEQVEISRVEIDNRSQGARFELNQTRFHEMEVAATFVLADGSRLHEGEMQRTEVLKPWHGTLSARCSDASREAALDLYERLPNATGTKFAGSDGSLRRFGGDVSEIESFEARATDAEGRTHTTTEAILWGSSNTLRFTLPLADLQSIELDFRLRLQDGGALTDDDFTLRLGMIDIPCSR